MSPGVTHPRAPTHHRPLDHRLQLAHVPGPVVALEDRHRVTGHARDVEAEAVALRWPRPGSARPGARCRRAARAAAAPRAPPTEPVVEVLAERAALHRRLEVAMGGGDDAHVDRDASRAAPTGRALALLEKAEQHPLGVRGAARRPRPGTACRRAAAARRPAVRLTAPVKAPRSWPNSSLRSSSRVSVGAVQRLVAAGRAGALRRWMALATSSLPVPDSPRIKTGRSIGANVRDLRRRAPASPRSGR